MTEETDLNCDPGLSWGGKVVEPSSAEAVLLISSGKELLDGILICFSRIAK